MGLGDGDLDINKSVADSSDVDSVVPDDDATADELVFPCSC